MASDSSQSRWSRSASIDDFPPRKGNRALTPISMQAALLVLGLLPPPAACAHVLGRQHGPAAGRAADRAVALVVQPVVGHAVQAQVIPHLALGPRRERIEFLQAV